MVLLCVRISLNLDCNTEVIAAPTLVVPTFNVVGFTFFEVYPLRFKIRPINVYAIEVVTVFDV